jgi:diadenosine tetraphosphatase ApaH/serine/threonine PP2A family protein phosphatase
MEALFSRIEHICFQGHTHLPGVFCDDDGRYCFEYGNEIDGDFVFDDRKFMVNVGSVGQPRDGDPRACYVILENRSLTYRRVKYDVERTARKIYATPELDDNLGSRLFGGR